MAVYFRSTPVTEPLAFHSLGIGWEQLPVSRSVGFPHYHFLLSQQGRGSFQTPSGVLVLEEGQGVLTAPFVPHRYEGLTDTWITAFATFTGPLAANPDAFTGGRPVVLSGKAQGDAIVELIARNMALLRRSQTDTRQLSVASYELLLRLTDGVNDRQLQEDPLYRQYVVPVIAEIETHYAAQLTVVDLSRLVFVSPQYLSRLFRRFLGCGTYEYLLSHRIARARELLLSNGRLSIQEIALQTGFDASSHFIATFKRFTGMTPKDFRTLYRQA